MKSNYIFQAIIGALIIFCQCHLKAQDTILFKDSTATIGIIKEKRSEEIVYKRYAFPEGPDYIVLKNSIKEIHYAGGLKEQFAPTETAVKTETKNQTEPFLIGESNERIDFINGLYYYKGESYTYNGIKKQVFSQSKDPRIQTMIKQKENNQTGYYASLIGIPITVIGVAAVVVGAADIVFGTGNSGIMESGLLATAGGIVTISLNTYFFEKKKYLSRKMVKIYNESY